MDAVVQPDDVLFRKRATRKMLLGFCGAFGIGAGFVVVCNDGYLPNSPLWSAFSAVPFVFFVAGMVECIIQRPWRELRSVWRTLKKSKRVLLGTFLSSAGFLAFILFIASLFHIWLIAFRDG